MPTYIQESDESKDRLAEAEKALRDNWPRRNEPGFDIQPFIDEFNAAGGNFTEIENDMHAESERFE